MCVPRFRSLGNQRRSVFSPTLALMQHPSSYSIFIVTNFFDRLESPKRDGNDISATGRPSYFTITAPFNPDLTMYSVDEMDNLSGTGAVSAFFAEKC
jgi:hypothetical protein